MLWEVEDQQESVLYGTHFIVREVRYAPAERTGVDCADHLTKNLRWLVSDRNLWVKARCERRA
jgi:hypothetical protein